MILGIGVDLLDIKRIKTIYSKFQERLPQKILSAEEFELFEKSRDRVNFLAKKFSAKEAFSKALGTGIGRGINFSDISIYNNILGKPIITLSEDGFNFVENLFKTKIENIQFHISTTDEDMYVNTFVVISNI